MLKLIFFISLSLASSTTFGGRNEEPVIKGKPEISKRTERIAKRFEKDVKEGRFQNQTHLGLDAVIRLAAYKLRRDGYKTEAKNLIKEWESQYQYVLLGARGQGDFKPLSLWLSEKYNLIEFILGKPTCDALRLSDLKIFNFSIPVCLWCEGNVNLEEYSNHFTFDQDYGYKGLAEISVFWISFLSCVGGTYGTGFLFCSPIAMGAEYLTEKFVAPKLEKPAWNWACKP